MSSKRLSGLIAAFASIGAAVWLVAGGPVIPLWIVALWALWRLLVRIVTPVIALAYATITFLFSELIVLHITPYIGVGTSVIDGVLWGVLALVVGVRTALRPTKNRVFSARNRLLALAVLIGPILLIGAVVLAQILPEATHLAWAMNADSVNVIGFARRMFADGGINPSSTPQPTPLPFALVASNMAGGREGLADDAVLQHDVVRLAETWVFAIALSCLLVGGLVAQVCAELRLRVALPVVALASTAGLTWYFIGVQFDGGFINSGFAILILVAGWLAYVGRGAHPIGSLLALVVASTILLAVWSPLVICLLGLGAVLFFGKARAVLTVRSSLLLALAVLFFLVYAFAFTLPALFARAASLGDDGGFSAIGPAPIFVIAAVTFAFSSVVATVAQQPRLAAGAIAVVGSGGIGLGYLLWQRRGAQSLWGYYPAKFAWTVSLLLLVIIVHLLVTLLERYPPRSLWPTLSLVSSVALVATLMWAPGEAAKTPDQLPMLGILRGGVTGNAFTETIFRYSGSASGHTVFWHSSEGDSQINYWLLQTNIPPTSAERVGAFANSPGTLSVAQICTVVALLGPNTVVRTADPMAIATLAASCSARHYHVVLEG